MTYREKKYRYPNDLPDSKCPYCGEKQKPCSEITSLARAYARGACSKSRGGVTLSEVSSKVTDDLDPDVY